MRTLVSLLLVALALSGCGLRVDAPDPTPSAASQDEVLRQREALRAAELATAGAGTELLEDVAARAAVQGAALGGVWRAWPDGDGPTPTTDPTSDVVVGEGGALAWLRATRPSLRDAVVAADDPDLATLLAAIAVARAVDEDLLALAAGEDPRLPDVPEDLVTGDPAVVRAIDGAAHVLEGLAARASAAGEDHADLARRAELWRTLADRMVSANGWEGTAADPREAFYEVGSASTASVENDLAVAFVTAIGGAADRQAMLEAAVACALAASRQGAEIGPLPGVR
ncbi:MAG: hypothetical protein EOL89_05350 [Actinobacteria bacterium]|nr:hypothetical protein [Actinomycetota bacterium]